MFVLVYFTLAECYFRVIVTSNFDVGNPSYEKLRALNKYTGSYGNETVVKYSFNHNFYSGSDTLSIRRVLQTARLTVSFAATIIL